MFFYLKNKKQLDLYFWDWCASNNLNIFFYRLISVEKNLTGTNKKELSGKTVEIKVLSDLGNVKDKLSIKKGTSLNVSWDKKHTILKEKQILKF